MTMCRVVQLRLLVTFAASHPEHMDATKQVLLLCRNRGIRVLPPYVDALSAAPSGLLLY